MSISFEGIGEVSATFLVKKDSSGASTVKPGNVVCLTGNNEVGLGTSGTVPLGVAASVSGDCYAGVVISGLVEVPYTGTTAPTAGWNTMAANGSGGMTVVTEKGASFLVISVDTTAETAVVKF